jgi:hypothetical protein
MIRSNAYVEYNEDEEGEGEEGGKVVNQTA